MRRLRGGVAWCLILGQIAAGSPSLHASETEEAPPEKTAPGPTVVEVPVLLMPVSTATGRLKYYAYLVVQLEIPKPTDRWSVEEKIPYIKDAFIRELHSAPNSVDNDPTRIDVEGVKARLMARIKAIFGDDRVGSIIIKDLAAPGAGQG